PTAIYVKVDSGLGRLGAPLASAVEFVKEVAALPQVVVEGLYTHLPFADPAGREWARTRLEEVPAVLRGLARAGIEIRVTQALSSAGILAGLDHGCTAVCPGHLLYGLQPVSAKLADRRSFQPVLRALRTRLIQVTRNPTARAVGAGGHRVLPGGAVTGVVPIGTGDGYRSARAGAAGMGLRGHRVPVLGVSLEHPTLALSAIPDPTVGNEVAVLGGEGDARVTLEELAGWQQVRPLDVLTALSGRMPIAVRRGEPRPA